MILHARENVHYQLIWNVIETLVKVADATLGMLLEHLELGVLLIQLVSDRPADDVGKHRLESLLVAVIILNGKDVA